MSNIDYRTKPSIQNQVYYNTTSKLGARVYINADRMVQAICNPVDNAEGCILFTAVFIYGTVDQNASYNTATTNFRQITDVSDGSSSLGLLFTNTPGLGANSLATTLYGSGTLDSISSDNIQDYFSSEKATNTGSILLFEAGSFANTPINVLGVPGLTYVAGEQVYVGTGKTNVAGDRIVTTGFFSPPDALNDQLILIPGFVFAEDKTLGLNDITINIQKSI